MLNLSFWVKIILKTINKALNEIFSLPSSFFLFNLRHFIPLHKTDYRIPLYTFLCHIKLGVISTIERYSWITYMFRFLALYRFRFTTVLQRITFLKKKTIKELNSPIYSWNQTLSVTYMLVEGASILAFTIHVWL